MATILTRITATRVSNSKCWSVGFTFISGLITFSERTTAGARMDELVVLITALNRDPKKRTCRPSPVSVKTILGSTS